MKTTCKIFSKIISCTIFFVGLVNIEPSKASKCIESIENDVVKWSISKIESSDIANVSSFTCDDAKNMNKMNGNEISITSGRRRGKATICLSDNKDYPCKFIIGFINPEFDSIKALSIIYSFIPPKSSELNETVERLFLKPSSLIN
tara:strand:- start:397 stop:834 length:438 start_codon:yes stop_codon:yes gene_type:complete